MNLTSGTKLGPYEILSPLGAGGMGEVYKARDTRLGREVAVKILPSEFAQDPERLRRFEQEARATAALDHPNILAVFDIGTHEGTPYIVEQLLEGESLRERLRGGRLSPAKALEFGTQISRGLAAAHGKGITHRDLKPDNLFVTKDGHVKILDFGLARLRFGGPVPEEERSETPTEDSPTREGQVLGTPGYMAPEQVRGQPTDARTDLFAFGVVLYEMLSGKRAFAGDTAADTQAAILTRDPDPLPPVTPQALDCVIRQCLEKRPEDRFSSAHDLALALEALSGAGPATPSPVPTQGTREMWIRRHPTILAVGAALVLAVALGALIWNPWRKPEPPGSLQVASTKVPSLVALPCKVLGSPESAYLTDAVPSTISAMLGQVRGIETKVPPTSSEVEKVQGDLAKIAKAYGVESLVLTTVTVQGNKLVLNVELARAETRQVLWGDQFEGTFDQYNGLARQAAVAIVEKLHPGSSAPVRSAASGVGSEAELAFQRGKFYAMRHFNHPNRADYNQALEAFQRAFELDPASAAAAAQISQLYGTARACGYVPRDQARAAEEAWLQQVLALAPRSAEAWGLLAIKESYKADADPEKEIEYSLRAAASAPRDPEAQRNFATMGTGTGGSSVLAAVVMREGLRMDPLYFQGYSVLASALADVGRAEEALEALDTQLSLDPGSWWGLLTKVRLLVEAGRTQEAAELFGRLQTGGAAAPFGDLWFSDDRWLVSLASGREGEARSALKTIIAHFEDPVAIWNWLQWDIMWLLPEVNRRLGKDAALDLLILSTKRGATYPYDALMLRPDFKELREDPRAKDVVRKTKAPFVLLIRILQDARAKGELPKYLEAPMDDLLSELQAKGAWP